jgi:aryl-alcohol dehydrogenase-like predicted oxidoreductase
MEMRPFGQTGLDVSVLSFGASSLGSVFRDVAEDEGIRAVHTALDLGMNFIDVSPYYGLTKAETLLGKALATVKRDRYFISTKVGRYGSEMKDFDFSAKRVTDSVEESLNRCQIEHFDILYCHDIEFGDLNQIMDETLPALEKIRKSGKCRFIGVTGLPLKVFTEVLGRYKIDSILSYCRFALNDTALEKIIPLCASKGVALANASPFSMGLLTDRPVAAWHPAPELLKQKCSEAAAWCKSQGVDIAQLALQYCVAKKEIPTTLVGSASAKNLEKNVKWIETKCDPAILAGVEKILAPVKNLTWASGRPENND